MNKNRLIIFPAFCDYMYSFYALLAGSLISDLVRVMAYGAGTPHF
jgi:hypothetical protein